jgi:hypothetical protein
MGITTSTTVGRDELLHPDLGHDGGSGLWNKVNTMFTKISDSLTVQYFGPFTVADTASQDVVHNFGMNLVDIDCRILESGVVLTQEQQAVYGISEKVGNTTKALTITNNSGGSKTFSVYAIGFSLDKLLGREKTRFVTSAAPQVVAQTIAVPTNESFAISLLVGVRKDGTNANYYKIEALAENNAGTASVRIVSKLSDEDVSAYDVTLDANSSNIRVLVTGEAATTVEWYIVSQKTYF